MKWGKEIIERIKPYDLILLDANFFGSISYKNDLVCKLHDSDLISNSDSIEEELLELNEDLHWKLEEIVEDHRVFTIKGVINEISDLKEIFLQSYQWHKRLLRFAQRRKPFREKPLKENIYYEKRLYRKKITESLIERTLKDIRENEINPYNNPQIFYILNSIIKNFEKVIRHLRIYQGPIEKVYLRIGDASDTDHLLVEAAFDCFLENQERKIAIISSDYHIEQISYTNSVYSCFDVITPLTISQKFDKVKEQQYAI